jgi:signal peptidase II
MNSETKIFKKDKTFTVWLLMGLACGILLLDFFSKAYIHSELPLNIFASPTYPYGGIGIFQNWHGIDFSIHHVANKGAAWGMLASFQDYLLYLRIFIIACMLGYLLFFKASRAYQCPFTLIIAGASGNVIDYFLYGHVIDMFHFTFWGYTYPVFNIADSAIFCGVVWLLFVSLFCSNKKTVVI